MTNDPFRDALAEYEEACLKIGQAEEMLRTWRQVKEHNEIILRTLAIYYQTSAQGEGGESVTSEGILQGDVVTPGTTS